jgi:uncharacterized membrane protein
LFCQIQIWQVCTSFVNFVAVQFILFALLHGLGFLSLTIIWLFSVVISVVMVYVFFHRFGRSSVQAHCRTG